MKKADYVIVGANVAAVGAIEGIRRYDTKSSILTISYETLGSYSKAMLAGYIEGESAGWLEYRGKDYFNRMGVDALYGRKVTALNPDKTKLVIEGGEEVGYKKLLLAVGGVPFKPSISGSENKKQIFSFTEFSDAHKIKEALTKFESVVVIGAGFTGTEIAYTLNNLNKKVSVIELGDRVLVKALDPRSSEIAEKLMKDGGIDFYLNDTVEEIAGQGNNDEITGVKLKSGKFIPCQAVITAIGVVPNGDLINNTGINFNRGLEVDDLMATNIPGVYGAGDVVKALDITDGQKRSLPLWPLAYQQGVVAGSNMAGANFPYIGGLPMNSLKFLKMPILSAGITTPPDSSYKVVSIDDPEASFYRSLVIKDGTLKGFVTVGSIDGAGVLTGLIKNKINIEDIKDTLLQQKRIGLINLPREWRNKFFTRRDETGYHD
ncbi:MAG: NAD(P)/FAD-dependent oxidoreductase [Nitrospirae bacterium]|nr:NAD(P)/FAD-dependent oxidoreductase [Nitrospirota bacterium]